MEEIRKEFNSKKQEMLDASSRGQQLDRWVELCKIIDKKEALELFNRQEAKVFEL